MPAFDLDSCLFYNSATDRTALTAIRRKRHDTLVIPVAMLKRGAAVELAEAASGIAGLKKKGANSGGFEASALGFIKEGAGANAIYYFAIDLNQMDGLFAPVGEGEAAVVPDTVSLILEIEIKENGRTFSTVEDITVTVINDYVQGGEGIPADADPPWGLPADYLTKAGNLEGLASAAAARVNLGAASQEDLDALDAQKGEPDGIATLDEGGKIPVGQLPDSVVGQLEYRGGWDADSNLIAPDYVDPVPLAAPENKGWYFVVLVAGASDPDGSGREFVGGDWIVSNGESWDKVDNTEPVATESLAGISARASTADAQAATNDSRHLTPAKGKSLLDARLASAAEVNQRRDVAKLVTPALLRAINVETLTGNKTLVAGDAWRQVLDPGAANRDVTLPEIASTPASNQVGYGHELEIRHGGSAYRLTVKNFSATEVSTLDTGEALQLVATAAGWMVIKLYANSAIVITYPAIHFEIGSAGDDVTIWTPPTGMTLLVRDAYIVTTSKSGTISTQAQVTLQAGATAISSALALGTTPAADDAAEFAMSNPRKLVTSANALILDKTTIAAGTTPVHIGDLVVTGSLR